MLTLGETLCGMYGNTPYYFCKFSVNLSLFLQKSLFKKFRSKVLQSNVTYWFGGLIGRSTIQFNFYILLRYNMHTVSYTNHVCTTHWIFTYRCTLLISTRSNIRMFPGPFTVFLHQCLAVYTIDWVLPVLELHVHRIIKNVFFWVWLLSLNIPSEKSIILLCIAVVDSLIIG